MRHCQKPWVGKAVWITLIGALLLVLPCNPVLANDFQGYSNYSNPANQHYMVMPEITGGWFDAIDYFPDNGANNKIGIYETRGRALVANHKYIYLQKNYGSGTGSGTWQPGDANGVAGTNMPGGNDNWIVVARVKPGVGSGHPSDSMDPSFIHISPDGTKVALGLGYAQPMLVFPISKLVPSSDPDSAPLLNSGTGGNTPAAGVTLFPWGGTPTQGVQYYEAEWVPDPTSPLHTKPDNTLNPAAAANNIYLAINTDRGWDGDSQAGDGSQIELLDTSDAANRPVVIIQNIGYAPSYSASADLTVDNYGNLITGQGYDYNNPDPTNPDSETGQIKIFAFDNWTAAYSGDWENPDPIEYNHTTNIIADKVLSAAAMGVDKDNNLHVGGGDVVSGTIGATGYAAVIHADALSDGLANAGPVDTSNSSMYKELQPDANGDDSATFAVYNPWAQGIVLIWNPTNHSGTHYGPYDAWSIGVQPVATTYYAGTPLDSDDDGIPDGSDNAYLTPNPGQEDTDGDGWANAADGDFDNNGIVNSLDYSAFRSLYNTSATDSAYDMNSDNVINISDYQLFRGKNGKSAPWY